MEYRVKTVQLSCCPIGPVGMVDPLCNFCKVSDCSHQIENRLISLVGVTKKWKLLVRGNEPYLVVECEGFSP